MTDKQVNTTYRIIYVIAAIMVIIGAFFRLQHYPNGPSISMTGFILGMVTIIFDRIRLKRKNENLEEQLKQKE